MEVDKQKHAERRLESKAQNIVKGSQSQEIGQMAEQPPALGSQPSLEGLGLVDTQFPNSNSEAPFSRSRWAWVSPFLEHTLGASGGWWRLMRTHSEAVRKPVVERE